jgi:hypothetical protein
LPVLAKAKSAYKLWREILCNFPKVPRYTIGGKIDTQFLATLEYIFRASMTSDTEKKLAFLEASIRSLDLVKFFLQIAWEHKHIDTKKYLALSEPIEETGRMLGGWRKGILSKTPAK